MIKTQLDIDKVVFVLNKIFEIKLKSVVRYTHSALVLYGYGRLSLVNWMRQQASECLAQANQAGQVITHFGNQPALALNPLAGQQESDPEEILKDSLEQGHLALAAYNKLFELAEGRNPLLEKYARRMIDQEKVYLVDISRMITKPAEIA